MAWRTQQPGTKHSPNCQRVFARYDHECPRCQELSKGAPPREGWNDRKEREYERFRKALASHHCQQSGCGPICTAFDY